MFRNAGNNVMSYLPLSLSWKLGPFLHSFTWIVDQIRNSVNSYFSSNRCALQVDTLTVCVTINGEGEDKTKKISQSSCYKQKVCKDAIMVVEWHRTPSLISPLKCMDFPNNLIFIHVTSQSQPSFPPLLHVSLSQIPSLITPCPSPQRRSPLMYLPYYPGTSSSLPPLKPNQAVQDPMADNRVRDNPGSNC